jgi:hypothetical protein
MMAAIRLRKSGVNSGTISKAARFIAPALVQRTADGKLLTQAGHCSLIFAAAGAAERISRSLGWRVVTLRVRSSVATSRDRNPL